jgi:hypothetical protein
MQEFRSENRKRMTGPGGMQVEIVDTWEMTIDPVAGTLSGEFEIALPSRPYMAIRAHELK